ncbi:hypothetical protein DL546_008180 [Coniochaeta pulveracea]|uniref:Uncharacterized protein n=1 Tax=Coniochaeta pulveracea TaxID=177199 RepID=A0A420YEZ2_9PEZI|nr:hypothetical protein DL546_008180 [Coniochaeta pulveracea]
MILWFNELGRNWLRHRWYLRLWQTLGGDTTVRMMRLKPHERLAESGCWTVMSFGYSPAIRVTGLPQLSA